MRKAATAVTGEVLYIPGIGMISTINDLPDDLWTKISIEFYTDAADAVFKALVE